MGQHSQRIYLETKWTKTLDWNFEGPDVKWFINGKFNITENAIDRHLPTKANQTAFIWEPNAVDGTHASSPIKICMMMKCVK